MEKQLQAYTSALCTLTHFVGTRLISRIIDLPNTEYEEPYKFFYTILHKTNNAIDTGCLLLSNYRAKPHYVDSLIIILRATITDCVIYRYLLSESLGGDETEKLKTNIKAIYFDHIQYTLKNVEKYFPSIHGYTDEQVRDTIADGKRNKPEYYDETGKATVKGFPASVFGILSKMASKENNVDDLEAIRSFYHFYDIYSKYEHPGAFSFQLIHQQYREQTYQSFANDIVYLITRLIVPTMSSILGAWPEIYATYRERYDTLVTHLVNEASEFHRLFAKEK